MMCHLVISGFVQGVGYRQFTKKTSLGLDLKGWVKNIDIEWEDKNMDFTQHQTGAGFNNFEIVI